jgi:hypothetical protein
MALAAAYPAYSRSASRNITSVISNCAGLFNILADLLDERIQVFEFLLRSKKFQETNFDILSVNVSIEIEEMNLENAL